MRVAIPADNVRSRTDGADWHGYCIVMRLVMPESRPPSLPFSEGQRPVILVADDEVLIRNITTILLQWQGYLVLSAADGQEGLDLSRKYPGIIDVLLTDVDMPRLNGMDLCTHLLKERPGIKIIVMSGSDMAEIVSRNANLPFLPKPFDGEALLARIRSVLWADHVTLVTSLR